MLSTGASCVLPEDIVDVVLLAWVGCSAVASDSSDASTTKYKLSATTSVVIVIASAKDFISFALPASSLTTRSVRA